MARKKEFHVLRDHTISCKMSQIWMRIKKDSILFSKKIARKYALKDIISIYCRMCLISLWTNKESISSYSILPTFFKQAWHMRTVVVHPLSPPMSRSLLHHYSAFFLPFFLITFSFVLSIFVSFSHFTLFYLPFNIFLFLSLFIFVLSVCLSIFVLPISCFFLSLSILIVLSFYLCPSF